MAPDLENRSLPLDCPQRLALLHSIRGGCGFDPWCNTSGENENCGDPKSQIERYCFATELSTIPKIIEWRCWSYWEAVAEVQLRNSQLCHCAARQPRSKSDPSSVLCWCKRREHRKGYWASCISPWHKCVYKWYSSFFVSFAGLFP